MGLLNQPQAGSLQKLVACRAEDTSDKSAAAQLDSLKGVFEQVGDELEPVPGVRLVAASGHTPGHLIVEFTSGSHTLVHIVDVAHNHVLMFQRPDWTVAFDIDPDAARATRKRLFAELAAKRSRIFGYHLPFPGVCYIRKSGDGYEYVPEPWGTT
jgi:glyoxylase-like metal-dependent hydrolase (beta-lactamase superfamily II)